MCRAMTDEGATYVYAIVLDQVFDRMSYGIERSADGRQRSAESEPLRVWDWRHEGRSR